MFLINSTIDDFMCGHCAAYALALHDLHGMALVAITGEREEYGETVDALIHAFGEYRGRLYDAVHIKQGTTEDEFEAYFRSCQGVTLDECYIDYRWDTYTEAKFFTMCAKRGYKLSRTSSAYLEACKHLRRYNFPATTSPK